MIQQSFASLWFCVEFQSMALRSLCIHGIINWPDNTRYLILSTYLLICSKMLIKQNPTYLFVLETKLFLFNFCNQYVIDNGVLHFTRKISFSNFNPADIERSSDINLSYITSKQCCMNVEKRLCGYWEHFLIHSYFHTVHIMIFRCEFLYCVSLRIYNLSVSYYYWALIVLIKVVIITQWARATQYHYKRKLEFYFTVLVDLIIWKFIN